MYNSEIKNRFLARQDVSGGHALPSFVNVCQCAEEKEISLGKDIAEMDKDTLISVLASVKFSNYNTFVAVLHHLRAYVAWCESQNIFASVSKAVYDISAKDIDFSCGIEEFYFENEEAVFSALRKVRPFDDGFIDPPIYALAWLGVLHKELVDFKDYQVDLERRIIYANDGSIIAENFSDLIKDVLRLYVDCNVSTRANRAAVYEIVKDKSVDTFLKRFFPRGSKNFGKGWSMAQIDTQLSTTKRLYEELGFKESLSFMNVWRSGRFHKLWELECLGVTLDEAIVGKVFRGNGAYKIIMRTYKAYKKAFSLE